MKLLLILFVLFLWLLFKSLIIEEKYSGSKKYPHIISTKSRKTRNNPHKDIDIRNKYNKTVNYTHNKNSYLYGINSSRWNNIYNDYPWFPLIIIDDTNNDLKKEKEKEKEKEEEEEKKEKIKYKN